MHNGSRRHPCIIFLKAVLLLLYFELHQQKCHGNLIFLLLFKRWIIVLSLPLACKSLNYSLSNPLQKKFSDGCSSGLSALSGWFKTVTCGGGEGSLHWFIQFSVNKFSWGLLCTRSWMYRIGVQSHLDSCSQGTDNPESSHWKFTSPSVPVYRMISQSDNNSGVLNVSACQWVTLARACLPRRTLRSSGRVCEEGRVGWAPWDQQGRSQVRKGNQDNAAVSYWFRQEAREFSQKQHQQMKNKEVTHVRSKVACAESSFLHRAWLSRVPQSTHGSWRKRRHRDCPLGRLSNADSLLPLGPEFLSSYGCGGLFGSTSPHTCTRFYQITFLPKLCRFALYSQWMRVFTLTDPCYV